MYNNFGGHQPGMLGESSNFQQPNPMGSAFYGAGPGIIRSGLGPYGEKILGSSSDYVQSNISKYFSDPQYYFQVNEQYVRNKLRVILAPFLHRGQWTRIREHAGGRLSYKPPIYDINAPDLYIPLMSFGTYVVLAGFAMGLTGKFSPEAVALQFSKGLIGWSLQILLLKAAIYFLGTDAAPLLDVVAYGGYAFVGVSLSVLAKIFWNYSYYVVMPWTCFCMAVLLVKTLKRMFFAPGKSYDKNASRHHYLLLSVAFAQIPLFFWLGYIGA
ncbi:unnamed protein product [Victoria cruziana]